MTGRLHRTLLLNMGLFIGIQLIFYGIIFWGNHSAIVMHTDSSVWVSQQDTREYYRWVDVNFGEERIFTSSYLPFYIYQNLLSVLPIEWASKLSLQLALVFLSISSLVFAGFNIREGSSKALVIHLLLVYSFSLSLHAFTFSQEILIYGLGFLLLGFTFLRKYLDTNFSCQNGLLSILFFSLLFHPALIILGLLSALGFLMFRFCTENEQWCTRKFLIRTTIIILLFLALNCYWILPVGNKLLFGSFIEGVMDTSFNQLEIFSRASSHISFLSSFLLFYHTQELAEHPIVSLVMTVLIMLLVYSATRGPYRQKDLSFFSVLLIVFWYLSLGNKDPLHLNSFLLEKLSFLSALRQPNKYLYGIALCYFFYLHSVHKHPMWNQRFFRILALLLAFTSITHSHIMNGVLSGFKITKDYQSVKQYFKDHNKEARALIFPKIPYWSFKDRMNPEAKGTQYRLDQFFEIPIDGYNFIGAQNKIKESLYQKLLSGKTAKTEITNLGLSHFVFHKDYDFKKIANHLKPDKLKELQQESKKVYWSLKEHFPRFIENTSLAVFEVSSNNPYLRAYSLDGLSSKEKGNCLSSHKKISPVEYRFRLTGSGCKKVRIEFKQNYHSRWTLNKRNQNATCQSFLVNMGLQAFCMKPVLNTLNQSVPGFGIRFEFDPTSPADEYILYFTPQIYFLIGTWISGLTALIVFMALIKFKSRKPREL